MPSTEHDIVGRFFREHPAFAAQLLSGLLGFPLPHYDEARSESLDFTDVQPTSVPRRRGGVLGGPPSVAGASPARSATTYAATRSGGPRYRR
jgi:hypothetical protein